MNTGKTILWLAMLGGAGCHIALDLDGEYTTARGGENVGGHNIGAGGAGGSNCHSLPNTPLTCGNGTVDLGEECDDGNCIASDMCNNNCRNPYCGDGVIQPSIGETCEGEADCCTMQSNSSSGTTNSSSSTSSGDPCLGKLIFAGFAAAQNGAFSYGGQIGLEAAQAACQAIGAFGMCEYDQWKQIESDPVNHDADVKKLEATITPATCQSVWLQRTTVAAYPPCGMAQFGPGGNCNEWNDPVNHLSDGEYVQVCNTGAALTYTFNLDCDPVWDLANPSPHQDQTLPCSSLRPIPCCYEKCTPMP